jgi:hypothetical protein
VIEGRLPDRGWRGHAAAAALLLAAALVIARVAPGDRSGTDSLPSRLSDAAFWQLAADLSEPGGSFMSDNFVSNEDAFQRVIPDLKRTTRPGGVYLGVGPDQNFTYIAALEPKIAFIIDIRRQNMLLHLLYKALIELSSSRAEFLSRLFSRPPPARRGLISDTRSLLQAYAAAVPDEALFERNVQSVTDQLVNQHRFALSAADLATIKRVYRAFFDAGPELRYAYPHRGFPTFADLVLETDDRGQPRSYLTTDESFHTLKHLETNNLIIPVVGDFAGTKAVRAIGHYLKAHRATVSVFYTSNVEFYLFENATWRDFFANVAALPLDSRSLFVRAHFSGASSAPWGRSRRSTTQLDPIRSAIGAYAQGQIRSYSDVIGRSRRTALTAQN